MLVLLSLLEGWVVCGVGSAGGVSVVEMLVVMWFCGRSSGGGVVLLVVVGLVMVRVTRWWIIDGLHCR